MMGNKMYRVTGKIVMVTESYGSGKRKSIIHEFNRTEYAPTLPEVIEVAKEKLEKKYGGDTRYYKLISFDVLQIDVFEFVYEEYNWDAHERAGLSIKDNYCVI